MNRNLSALYPAHVQEMCLRSQDALSASGFDHLLIAAGNEIYKFLDDMPYPFVPNPQFTAWVPLTLNPGCWIVHTPGQRPQLIYLQPEDYWHIVPQAPSGYWVEQFDIHVIRKPEQALALLPKPASRCAILGDGAAALGEYVPNMPETVVNLLDYRRARKTPYELECMRAASLRGARAHVAAERAFRAGASEYAIHLAYCEAADHSETELPYSNIIALNEHAAILHYHALDRRAPAQSHAFLIDAGAQVNGYASDITRTWSNDPAFSELVDAVGQAQLAMVAEARAGTDYRDLHVAAHHKLAVILKALDFVRMSPESMVESGVSATFFPHGIGHFIGLQVHDVGGFMAGENGGTLPKPEGHRYLRLTRTLEAGHVVTIEPGIYFIDMLLAGLRQGPHSGDVNWARVETFRKFGGVRVEDDVHVTDAAPENLTRDAFAALAA